MYLRMQDPHHAVVVIGRNEGERLRRCLESVVGGAERVVYVDSGSTDDSVKVARSLGAEIIVLDATLPFTAARARNVGFDALTRTGTEVSFVQFVDGDCELAPGWIATAARELKQLPQVAAVAGRLRERRPDASIYNRLCDMEWNVPTGEVEACGGICMMRSEAMHGVGGFREDLIAGEEPELCVRLRQRGWTIWRIDAQMGWHDADMTRFGQWWIRAARSGHAFAEGMDLHGRGREHYNVRRVVSALVWGVGVPVLLLVSALATIWEPWCALAIPLLLVGCAVLGWRIYRGRRQGGNGRRDALLYSAFCVVGKLPVSLGILKYWIHRRSGRRVTLIEYKTGAA